MDNISESVNKFEKDLNLPNKFYESLLNENDWSFVIKLSAFLEAVCTDLLLTKFKDNNLENSLAILDYANPRCGKINFLEKMKVIEKEQASVLFELATIRNNIVHKIKNVNFTFENYIKDLDSNKEKQFIKKFGHGINDTIKFKDLTIQKNTFVIENPKLAIWITIKEIVGCFYLEKELEKCKEALTFTVSQKNV